MDPLRRVEANGYIKRNVTSPTDASSILKFLRPLCYRTSKELLIYLFIFQYNFLYFQNGIIKQVYKTLGTFLAILRGNVSEIIKNNKNIYAGSLPLFLFTPLI